MSYFEPPEPDYSQYSTFQLLAIPVTVLVLAVLILSLFTVMTGSPVDRGTEFTGGTEVRLDVDSSIDNPEQTIRELFSSEPESITAIPNGDSYIVTFAEGEITPDQIESDVDQNDQMTISELSTVSPSLGNDAQITAIYGMLAAFLLMSILVIGLFRSIIPAFIIVLSAVSNILIASATMNLVGIQLSMGTVGALLMLIGYSVDSDILMNKYVLGNDLVSFQDNIHDAMRTGVTMTITSLSAMVVMFIVATLFGIGLLADMGFVLAVGLIADLMNTYLMNVSILRWYVNRGDSQ